MAQNSVFGIATRYGLDGPGIKSRGGGRFSPPILISPGVYPASYTVGTGSFLQLKRPGSEDNPLTSSTDVKERV